MKTAIMQPYFLPYIGYFQLIHSVDTFVVYDNIKFTKKGWINRNRFLNQGKVEYFTINIAKDSDYLNVNERKIAPIFFQREKKKLIEKIRQNYQKAINYEEFSQILLSILNYDNNNLFEYIYNSIIKIVKYLQIQVEIIKSSDISIDHSLKKTDKIIEICKSLGTTTYINAIGGRELYSKEEFLKENIELKFIETRNIVYSQLDNHFYSNLSIMDLLMHNTKDIAKEMLKSYELV